MNFGGLFKNPFRKSETSGTARPSRWFIDWLLGGSESAAGITINAETAQRVVTVAACVQVLSEDIAKLPLILYRRRADGGRDRATEHPLHDLVGAKPNARMTSFEWREMMQGHLLLRGNAYSRKLVDGRGRLVALIPLHPDRVQLLRAPDDDIFYEYRLLQQDKPVRVHAGDMLHLRDRSEDGYLGCSRIARHRDALGLARVLEIHGGKVFANGARPGGLLIPKGKINKEGRDVLRADWNEQFRGADKANGVGVLGEEFTYTPLGMTAEDAQYLETRKFSREEVCAIFRVPPHKVGILERSTNNNIEHQALEYVQDTLLGVARRWETALNMQLLSDAERGDYYFELLLDGLLRGDFKSRMEGYAKGIQWGIFNPNECRERENMNHRDGGDTYFEPLNMWPSGEPRPDKSAGDAAAADDAAPATQESQP